MLSSAIRSSDAAKTSQRESPGHPPHERRERQWKMKSPHRMRIIGLLKTVQEVFPAPRRSLVIAILTPLLIGSIAIAVMKVRGGQNALDTNQLNGKVFLVRSDWGISPPNTPGGAYIAVMNANGTDSRIVTKEFDRVFQLVWYPQLGSLGLLNLATTTARFGPGLYTVKVHGQKAADVSVDRIERSIPNDFSTRFFDPKWLYGGGRNILVPDSRSYGTGITFSPDGHLIAGIASFINPEGKAFVRKMCVVPTDGSLPESCNLSVEPCEGQSPVWSPDGTKIVFPGAIKENNSTSCNLFELYIADADVKNAVQLTNIDGPKITEENKWMVKPGMKLDYWHKSSHPKWSPDGHWIAFMSYGGIYRIHPDGTGLQRIIRNGNFPEWSPDGTMLMYVVITGSPFATSGPSDRIFVARADGSNPTEVEIDEKGPSRYTYTDLNWAE
jgi:WD40-like Beta Propeller Repeat